MQAVKNTVGRKGVVATVAAVLITGAFVAVSWKAGPQAGDFKTYSDAILYLAAAFFAGNVGEHFGDKKNGAPTSTADEPKV